MGWGSPVLAFLVPWFDVVETLEGQNYCCSEDFCTFKTGTKSKQFSEHKPDFGLFHQDKTFLTSIDTSYDGISCRV